MFQLKVKDTTVTYTLQVLRFSWWCDWGLCCPGIWYHIIGWSIPNTVQKHSAVIFKGL